MRNADGFDPRRRTADALADRQNRRGAGCAEKVHLSLHQRAAPERKVASFQAQQVLDVLGARGRAERTDRKSTRLNSSHGYISYAVFCLKKKITSVCIPSIAAALARSGRRCSDRR